MRPGYLIACVDVTDAAAYPAYIAANAAAFAKYGGRFLPRGSPGEVVEGRFRDRLVVLEVPSRKAAGDCCQSPEYAQAVPLRQRAAITDLAVVDGHADPLPGVKGGGPRGYWVRLGEVTGPVRPLVRRLARRGSASSTLIPLKVRAGSGA